MKSRLLQIMVLGLFLPFLGGCREYDLYRFKPVSLSFEKIELLVQLDGMYGKEYKDAGKKKADWGFPYSLQFFFETKEDAIDFDLVQVVEVELRGLKSKKHHRLPDSKTRRINDLSKSSKGKKEGFTGIISIGGIDSDSYDYENYEVSARILFCKGDEILREKTLKIVLKTDFRRSRRSDWIDEQMSV